MSWTLDAATTYYRNTGDTAFARQILPWLEGQLAYDATLTGTDGLIVTGPQISTTNGGHVGEHRPRRHGHRGQDQPGARLGLRPDPILTGYVLGVQSVKPGYQTFTVSPHPGSLRWTEGRVPTPYGQILVRWTRDGHRFSLTVAVPARSTAFIRLPRRAPRDPAGRPARDYAHLYQLTPSPSRSRTALSPRSAR